MVSVEWQFELISFRSTKATQQSTMGKKIWYSFDARNFGCDVSVRPPVCTDSGGGEGESRDNPTGGVKNAIFSWWEIAHAFGQLVFFLVGNRMTTVAFERGFLKA